jgi:oligoribonuclease
MMKRDQNLVWIDLEMTGLNSATDVILEIATIITDSQLNIIAEGPVLIIHQPDDVLAAMGEWCQKQHGKTGLTEAVRVSTVTLEDACQQTLAFIKEYCAPQTALLSGSSIWQDRVFLQRYMPSIVDYLYYKMIDVTTVKELVTRWYPNNPNVPVKPKDGGHRALDDIRGSINALKLLRESFFIKTCITDLPG